MFVFGYKKTQKRTCKLKLKPMDIVVTVIITLVYKKLFICTHYN